ANEHARADTTHKHFPQCVLGPSLIDCHAHLVLEADGAPGESILGMSDSFLLARARQNAGHALNAGVTTVADQGGPQELILQARERAAASPATDCSLVVAGRPLTAPSEHMWFFGGETSGADLAQATRALLQDGVDFVKLVATGGGTLGSNEY